MQLALAIEKEPSDEMNIVNSTRDEIWQTLKENPKMVVDWYRTRWEHMQGADLLFLCRSCYGGVVRFRMRDGYMSTPCGAHEPIHPGVFARRVAQWSTRVAGTTFFHRGYEESLERARSGDVVYCDPPYAHSQAILYGAQNFTLDDLFRSIERARKRGVFVAMSIDGSKKSGEKSCPIEWPGGLFAREEAVNVGRSMLRRRQMGGETLEAEVVSDRLLLTH
ncbi:site-specific DNA methylase [Gluconacetobacter johannae DSM 13595]|uniref:site-specific DNA-methyltransferase (adenine-specific) n=1 Tax=Gluconacetobacter johannae TaxID=112140 RepID=A0A7W4P2A3_9PROT|nr:DNA adenine methylase [Gluconacetobacter johannae]MBB2174926.1 DNA adenine methylase [Gluconacetobacter johannae]GBQ87820.1 site-specific DNA methylase [Gluconacetobacter johannae DSM 13595]